MSGELSTLSVAAVTLGFFHCVGGPDHYIPFVAMSRVGMWSLRKTLLVTVLCGIGHILGSVALGMIGIALGLIIFELETDSSFIAQFELWRGDLAAWLLVAFGVVYLVWGIYYAVRKRKATLEENNEDTMRDAEQQATTLASRAGRMTPWILFTIFLFGPCEALIPLMMQPAADANLGNALWIAFLFGATTLVTMTAMVALISAGISAGSHLSRFKWARMVPLKWAEIYGHALGGFVLLLCGLAMIIGL